MCIMTLTHAQMQDVLLLDEVLVRDEADPHPGEEVGHAHDGDEQSGLGAAEAELFSVRRRHDERAQETTATNNFELKYM